MRKKFLTVKAHNDIRGIHRYTRDNFGVDQAIKYIGELRLKIEQLRLQPGIGIDRNEELGRDIHSCFVGSHTIFYVFDRENITILEILHQSSLPRSYVDRSAGEGVYHVLNTEKGEL